MSDITTAHDDLDLSDSDYRARMRRKRSELLEEIEAEVASGRLVIRQATAAERERYGIKPRRADGDGDA